MSYSRLLRRYVAYYRGWCQAFGEHEVDEEPNNPPADDGIQWLFGENRVGLILPEEIRKRFLKELVSRKTGEPSIGFSRSSSEITINDTVCSVLCGHIERGVPRLVVLAKQHSELHMFLTHHLCYAPGTRIITFSSTRPLGILYKEIDPLVLFIR
ncbi:MAG: hypothetical protein ACFCVA_14790 [Gammaproteobacteria bacterium]